MVYIRRLQVRHKPPGFTAGRQKVWIIVDLKALFSEAGRFNLRRGLCNPESLQSDVSLRPCSAAAGSVVF